MVPQGQVLNPHQSALLRALDRATTEKIVVYRVDASTLGVATMTGGSWAEKPYHISVTGERPQDCHCDCTAARNGRPCKHLATALLARKYHVYAHRPEAKPGTGACITCGALTSRTVQCSGSVPFYFECDGCHADDLVLEREWLAKYPGYPGASVEQADETPEPEKPATCPHCGMETDNPMHEVFCGFA
jgi:hypothetical protein